MQHRLIFATLQIHPHVALAAERSQSGSVFAAGVLRHQHFGSSYSWQRTIRPTADRFVEFGSIRKRRCRAEPGERKMGTLILRK